MLSLQGPQSARLLAELLGAGALPEAGRNRLRAASGLGGTTVIVASTGYAGEALGFELFLPAGLAVSTWDRLLSLGAVPVGLGARDTLRLEAGLPLYGHELGAGPGGPADPDLRLPAGALRRVPGAGQGGLRGQGRPWPGSGPRSRVSGGGTSPACRTCPAGSGCWSCWARGWPARAAR